MELVIESPIRYNSWTNAGLKSSFASIGTNMGAKIAHFADPLPIKIFTAATNTINRINKTGPVRPVTCKNSAPLMARIESRFDQLKADYSLSCLLFLSHLQLPHND